MIAEVSDALVDTVHRATPDLGDWVVQHSLSQGDTSPGVPENKGVLALVAVGEHGHLRNRPLVEGVAGLVRPPLALRLHYLVTYWGPHDEAQTRLARVIQAFHTTPVLRAPDCGPPLTDDVDTITVRLLDPTPDERNQVWGALGRSGRLALFYQADVAPVPVLEREGAGRVREHRVEYVGATA